MTSPDAGRRGLRPGPAVERRSRLPHGRFVLAARGERGTGGAGAGTCAAKGAVGRSRGRGRAGHDRRGTTGRREHRPQPARSRRRGPFDNAGLSVAISGDTAVVGAWADDVAGNFDQGSASVFTRVGGVWLEEATLTAADGDDNDQFGISVAISGDTVVVGANLDDVGANANQGSAYVFIRSGGVWSQQQQLVAAGGAPNDQFGTSVAVAGDTAVVGSALDTVGANAAQGSAVRLHAHRERVDQPATRRPRRRPGRPPRHLRGGGGRHPVAGAYLDDVGASRRPGVGHVFTRAGGVSATPSHAVRSRRRPGRPVRQLGGGVGRHRRGRRPRGRRRRQRRPGIGLRVHPQRRHWTQQQQLAAAGGTAGDIFGGSVAISGDTVVVGALSTTSAAADQGSAFGVHPQRRGVDPPTISSPRRRLRRPLRLRSSPSRVDTALVGVSRSTTSGPTRPGIGAHVRGGENRRLRAPAAPPATSSAGRRDLR